MVETLPKKQKIGFVASGGAAKAACFHMGVALALQRKGFSFRSGLSRDLPQSTRAGNEIEVLVGSSAGAFACDLIASGQPLEEIYSSFLGHRNPNFQMLSYGEMLDMNLRDSILRFLPRLPKSLAIRGMASLEALVQSLFCANGFFTTNKIERYLRRQLMPSNRFADYAAELYIVTTTLDNPGRLICGPRELVPLRRPLHYYDDETRYATDIEVSHASAASMSLPPVFKPYPLRTRDGIVWTFDGEIRKTLSTHIAKDAGCDLIIASYTHQPYRQRDEIGSLIDYGIPSILVQALYQLIESRIMNAKETHDMKKMVVEEVISFFKRHQFSDAARDELLQILTAKLNFNQDVHYIYIHPSSHQDDLFFSDHFNLSPASMEKIAESGFRSAVRALKDYNFTFSGETLAEKAG